MAEQYEGIDEATLNEMLNDASSYEERSAIRKALRKAKGDGGRAKKTGSSTYRRAGYQAATKVTIPNSVTGNVLPNKVSMEHPGKIETPQGKSTISYLKKDTEKAGSTGRRSTTPTRSRLSSKASTGNTPEPRTPDLPKEEVEDDKPRSSQAVNITVEETPSPQPPAIQTRVNGEREASPEQERETTPEPVREPTPEPVREPSPPPREPTPEPHREPTPEPEPPREPTPEPEPPREPTPEPEPPREPTPEPEPPREPTPEPEPEKEEEEEEERVKGEEVESEEEEEEEEEEEYDEEDDDEEEEERRATRREQRRRGGSEDRQGQEYRPGRAAGGEKKVGTVIPTDVLTRKEEGIDGDFRKKLQKTAATKIDTRAAFPQAKTKGEQVDFRNVLKKTGGPEKKVYKGGVQQDFRSELKKAPKDDAGPPPVRAKKPRARRDEEERQASEEPAEQEEEQPPKEEVAKEEEEAEPEEKEAEPEVEQEEEQQEEESGGIDETDAAPSRVSPKSKVEEKEDDYEVRVAERRRRREERRKELEEMGGGTSPSSAPAKEEEEQKPVENGTDESSSPREKQSSSPAAEVDSYEARREARRKAREERLKAAAARVEEKQPKLSYRERKAREQMANAKENRKKWENREEESGEKTEAKSNVKKGNTATQQLLAWCQHKTKYYENVEVKDFRQSWSDGLAFCAIMHSFLPDKIPYDDLSADNPKKNFEIAFEAAEDAGIPRMLDVDDMISVKIPDAKSIMTFLVTIYQHFNS